MEQNRKQGDQYIRVEDDAVYNVAVEQVYGSGISLCSTKLVMTRDAFTQCYREWIQPKRSGWKNRVRRRR